MAKSSKNNFDILVQGNDLTSLLLVSYFEKMKKKIAWVTDDVIGGACHGFSETPFGMIASDWSFYPSTPELQKCISKLNEYLGFELPKNEEEINFINLSKGEKKAFFGFGADKVNLVDAVSEIVQNKTQVNMALFFDAEIDKLKRSVNVELFPQSSITNFAFSNNEDAKANNEKIDSIKVNGKNKCFADQYFLGFNSKKVQKEFSQFLTKKQTREMNKSKLYSSVHVTFIHNEKLLIEDVSKDIHVLYGKKADVALGKFSLSPEGHLCSHWMNFLDNEEGLEDEAIASKIKEIKKQIKRMYPDIFNDLRYSKISLNKELWGHCLGELQDPIGLSADSNFFFTNGVLSRNLTRSDAITNFCAIIETYMVSNT